MKRKEFLHHACGLGLCSCTVAALFAAASASSAEAADSPPEDWRIDFAKRRYARLVAALTAHAGADTTAAALEDVGRYCASTTDLVRDHTGQPEAFLEKLRAEWHADVGYDREKGEISLAFPLSDTCYCPLAVAGETPAAICQCSVGWQRQAFETVFGQPVHVEIKETILRGGTRCSFVVHLTPPAAA